jgi:hypothetical protein
VHSSKKGVTAIACTSPRFRTGAAGRHTVPALLAGAGFLSLFGAPARAADPTLTDCIGANESSLQLRGDHKLRQARAQSLTCAMDSCPVEMREECKRRVAQLNIAVPTMIFVVKDATGSELSAVKVSMDGTLLADRLEGTAMSLDPGEHKFTFEAPGQPPFEKTILVHEAEKERREVIVIGGAPQAPDKTKAPADAGNAQTAGEITTAEAGAVANGTGPEPQLPTTDTATGSTGMNTQQILGLTAGGIGVAGLVLGSVFAALTASAISQQNTDCPTTTNCPNRSKAESDHSAWTTDGTVSTASFIAGGVLAAAGVALFFTARHPAEKHAAAGVVVAPALGPGAGGMFLRGEF